VYSNAPKDMITYLGRNPILLLEAMGKHSKNEDDLFHVHIQVKDVRRWIYQAKVAIRMYPWLDDYFFPFKD
jgi:hypothetical protein